MARFAASIGTSLLALLVVVCSAPVAAVPAHATLPTTVEVVEFVPLDGTVLRVAGRSYRGRLDVRPAGRGLALVETTGIDDYLAGIREVPFSWPDEALAAQAVAARTYLAWTLRRGRVGAGRSFGFDICATTDCQVYAGAGELGRDGDRWVAAVARTSGQILEYDGRPAQALYSSSAGSRTRAVQDIFGGDDLAYLQPVDSPEAGTTPFEAWTVRIPGYALLRILGEGGYALGAELRALAVVGPPEGEGGASLRVETELGVTSIPVTRVRSVVGASGPRLYPGLLPGPRPGGGRWPQAILSYTFDAHVEGAENARSSRIAGFLPRDDLPGPSEAVFEGEGWGHGVGMSQWGAKALADRGAGYADILAHYYGGLAPTDGTDLLPDTVRVGLAWGAGEFVVSADGPFSLVVNGIPVRVFGGGDDWTVRRSAAGLSLVPPIQHEGEPGLSPDRRWPR